DAGFPGHVLERSIAAIVVERRAAKRQASGPAKHRQAFPLAVRRLAGKRSLGQIEILITGHQQIEVAIAIVIQKGTTRTPFLPRATGSAALGDVRELAVSQ